jgi:amidase
MPADGGASAQGRPNVTVHRFSPTVFHRTFGSHEPVATIRSGDTVVTTTVDAAGRDAADEAVTVPGNPLTGPFFIEGAEPGDALTVHLEIVRPNRRRGYGAFLLAPVTVDPEAVTELGASPEGYLDWDVDVEAGVARPLGGPAALRALAIPLAPMLGCIGVAPERGQAISTATSGPYGGNMDYRGIVAGAAIELPVYAAGALLFVGDGHAVQGAGELTGTGVEVSMDVRFRVELRKGAAISWPRGRHAGRIFTLGNARPLDQAAQHATTEMLRWLRTDFALDAVTASVLIGQCADLEVGNMFDPAYTVVCGLEEALVGAATQRVG